MTLRKYQVFCNLNNIKLDIKAYTPDQAVELFYQSTHDNNTWNEYMYVSVIFDSACEHSIYKYTCYKGEIRFAQPKHTTKFPNGTIKT